MGLSCISYDVGLPLFEMVAADSYQFCPPHLTADLVNPGMRMKEAPSAALITRYYSRDSSVSQQFTYSAAMPTVCILQAQSTESFLRLNELHPSKKT